MFTNCEHLEIWYLKMASSWAKVPLTTVANTNNPLIRTLQVSGYNIWNNKKSHKCLEMKIMKLLLNNGCHGRKMQHHACLNSQLLRTRRWTTRRKERNTLFRRHYAALHRPDISTLCFRSLSNGETNIDSRSWPQAFDWKYQLEPKNWLFTMLEWDYTYDLNKITATVMRRQAEDTRKC